MRPARVNLTRRGWASPTSGPACGLAMRPRHGYSPFAQAGPGPGDGARSFPGGGPAPGGAGARWGPSQRWNLVREWWIVAYVEQGEERPVRDRLSEAVGKTTEILE